MKISILTLFPEMFDGVFDHSIIKLAQKKHIVSIDFVNIRDFGIGRHKVVDDTPYGGGAGMILRADVIDKAIQSATSHEPRAKEGSFFWIHKENHSLRKKQGNWQNLIT